MNTTHEQFCYSHNHMNPLEFAIWNYAKGVSHKTKSFHASGRVIAANFKGVSKWTINRAIKTLTASGWFELLTPAGHNRMGWKTPPRLRPLSHEEYGNRYPNKCNECLERVSKALQSVEDEMSLGAQVHLGETSLGANHDEPRCMDAPASVQIIESLGAGQQKPRCMGAPPRCVIDPEVELNMNKHQNEQHQIENNKMKEEQVEATPSAKVDVADLFVGKSGSADKIKVAPASLPAGFGLSTTDVPRQSPACGAPSTDAIPVNKKLAALENQQAKQVLVDEVLPLYKKAFDIRFNAEDVRVLTNWLEDTVSSFDDGEPLTLTKADFIQAAKSHKDAVGELTPYDVRPVILSLNPQGFYTLIGILNGEALAEATEYATKAAKYRAEKKAWLQTHPSKPSSDVANA